MGKKIFEVYLAKEDVPNNEAYAKLDLPASLWELWDALDKVRLLSQDIPRISSYPRVIPPIFIPPRS